MWNKKILSVAVITGSSLSFAAGVSSAVLEEVVVTAQKRAIGTGYWPGGVCAVQR